MPIYFSADPVAFWHSGIHRDIPAGAIQISDDLHAQLLAGQSTGKMISADARGRPVLVDRPPAPPLVPDAISRFQGRQALRQAGLLDAAEAAISQASLLIQDAWADTVEWRRDSATIALMAGALNLSDAQVDDLFRQAATITA